MFETVLFSTFLQRLLAELKKEEFYSNSLSESFALTYPYNDLKLEFASQILIWCVNAMPRIAKFRLFSGVTKLIHSFTIVAGIKDCPMSKNGHVVLKITYLLTKETTGFPMGNPEQ